jgi:hypothetical protein
VSSKKQEEEGRSEDEEEKRKTNLGSFFLRLKVSEVFEKGVSENRR